MIIIVNGNFFLKMVKLQFNQNKIKNVGFVLNDVSKNYFGYGNKYGYGYGAKEKSWIEKIKERL